MHELKLVHSIFDKQVQFTLNYLSSLNAQHWQTKMSPWDAMFFHKLANDVNVEDVIKHTIITEQHLIYSIGSLEDGGVISLEGDEDVCKDRYGSGELVACYQEIHQQNLTNISNFSQKDLDKQLIFINQPYSGIGLLWFLTGHHAFHLGQLRSMNLDL